MTSEQDIPYVREEIVQKYHFTKVNIITSGGAERYLSVGRALQLIADGRLKVPNEHGYVFIHDGARPFAGKEVFVRTYEAARLYGAAIAAVPLKDTVKIVDSDTDEVIRQIPPEELLNLTKQLKELSGSIINTVS